MKGLIIRQPWIDLILEGKKTWEMRSQGTNVRGEIALIRKGSGLVFGVARLVASLPALGRADYMGHRDKHAIPAQMLDEVMENGWVYPWVLESVRLLAKPVDAHQKPGAVIFVNLDDTVVEAIAVQVAARGDFLGHDSSGHRLPAAVVRPKTFAEPPATKIAPTPMKPRGEPMLTTFAYRPEEAQAFGLAMPDGEFKVLAGSTAMRRGSASVKRDEEVRNGLVRNGTMVPDVDPRLYRFSRDHTFSSASKAAGVIKDGNASGLTLWKDESAGKNLKQFLASR